MIFSRRFAIFSFLPTISISSVSYFFPTVHQHRSAFGSGISKNYSAKKQVAYHKIEMLIFHQKPRLLVIYVFSITDEICCLLVGYKQEWRRPLVMIYFNAESLYTFLNRKYTTKYLSRTFFSSCANNTRIRDALSLGWFVLNRPMKFYPKTWRTTLVLFGFRKITRRNSFTRFGWNFCFNQHHVLLVAIFV